MLIYYVRLFIQGINSITMEEDGSLFFRFLISNKELPITSSFIGLLMYGREYLLL
jgi:hypothetical protein